MKIKYNEDGLRTFQVLAYKLPKEPKSIYICGRCKNKASWLYPPIFMPNPTEGWSQYNNREHIMTYIDRFPVTCTRHKLISHPARVDYK